MKRAKHKWRLAGGEGLVRTLSAEEFERFRDTNELPKPGNVSTALIELATPFGRLYMRKEPTWLLERFQRDRLEQARELHDKRHGMKLAGHGLLNEWVRVGRYSVLNTAREGTRWSARSPVARLGSAPSRA
jgi:hypothetical protein